MTDQDVRELITQSQVIGEMVAEGIVEHEGNDLVVTDDHGRKFLVEVRVLEVTGA